MTIQLFQVDSFTTELFKGNPAGVCILTNDISNIEKQCIASEMNCSETAFIIKRGDHYRISYFTPTQEIQLCGHATLASAHILWEEKIEGNNATIIFKANAEVISVSRDGDLIKMSFPKDTLVDGILPIDIKSAIGYSEGVVAIKKSSIGWFLIEVESSEKVVLAAPDFAMLKEHETIIIVTSASEDNKYDFVSRFFAPHVGINEDPVTGYAHTTLGEYWSKKLKKRDLTGYQLSRRKGIVRVIAEDSRTQILGKATTAFEITLKETFTGK